MTTQLPSLPLSSQVCIIYAPSPPRWNLMQHATVLAVGRGDNTGFNFGPIQSNTKVAGVTLMVKFAMLGGVNDKLLDSWGCGG